MPGDTSMQKLLSSRIWLIPYMWSKSKSRKEEVVRTDNRRGRTSKLCFTMRSSFYLCLYGWCPAMEKTKSTLLWFFYFPLSEPVQVKATSHLCGPYADHFFCCTLCSLLLNWTVYHYLMNSVFFYSFWFHVCVIRCLCDFLHFLPALRAWTYCFSFCSYTCLGWHESLPSIYCWVLCFVI